MKTLNVTMRSNLMEKTSPRTLTLKKSLGIVQEAKIKSLLGESFQEKKSLPLNSQYIKLSQQYRLREALELLRDLYPKSFTRETPKPLKIGIDKDIIKKGYWPYSARFLRRVLSFYTNSLEYQQNLLEETCRYSLEGYPVEAIRDQHKAAAREKLKLQCQEHEQSPSVVKPLAQSKTCPPF